MANISEITQGASYQGNPALGGGFGVGVTIDATPLDKLAAFTFQKDSMLYEQKQKDDVKAAAEIADTLNLDITNTLPQYQDDLKAKMIDLQEFYRKNPNSVVYGRDPKGFQEAKEKKRILTTALKNAKATDLAYQLKKTNIDTLPDGAEKEMKKAFLEMSLEEHFNEGVDKSYSKVLKTDPTITPESYKIPEIPSSEISEITILPNQFVTTETKYRNPSAYYTLGNVALLNTDYKKIDTESEDFKNLTEKQKIAKIRESEFKYANRQALQNQSNELANVLNQMQKRFGEENPDANFELTKENIANYSTSKTVTDLLNSFIEFNEKSKEIKTLTTTNNGGKDPTGKVVDPNLINGMGIDELITPAGIVALKKFAADGNTFLIKQGKTINESNEQIKKETLKETIRSNKVDEGLKKRAQDIGNNQFMLKFNKENEDNPKNQITPTDYSIKSANDIYQRILNNGSLDNITESEAGLLSGLGKWDKDQNRFIPSETWQSASVTTKNVKDANGNETKQLYINDKLVYENDIADNIKESILKQSSGKESLGYNPNKTNTSNASGTNVKEKKNFWDGIRKGNSNKPSSGGTSDAEKERLRKLYGLKK